MNYIFTHHSGDLNNKEKKRGLILFFNSILKNVKGCKVKFFTQNLDKEIPDELKDIFKNNTDVIEVVKVKHLRLNIGSHCQRFFYYIDYINKHHDEFSNSDKFMHCDNSDVLFFDNIFDKLDNDDKVHIFREDERFLLDNGALNTIWLFHIGHQVLIDRVGKNVVCCSGTILANTLKSFIAICTDMCFAMMRCITSTGDLMNDQGIFNMIVHDTDHLIYSRDMIEFHRNEEPDLIFTMGVVDYDHKPVNDRIFVYDRFPSVIHQYNRHPEVFRWAEEII